VRRAIGVPAIALRVAGKIVAGVKTPRYFWRGLLIMIGTFHPLCRRLSAYP